MFIREQISVYRSIIGDASGITELQIMRMENIIEKAQS